MSGLCADVPLPGGVAFGGRTGCGFANSATGRDSRGGLVCVVRGGGRRGPRLWCWRSGQRAIGVSTAG